MELTKTYHAPMSDITKVPARIEGPSACYGPDMARDRSWIEPLTSAIAEIYAAVRAVGSVAMPERELKAPLTAV